MSRRRLLCVMEAESWGDAAVAPAIALAVAWRADLVLYAAPRRSVPVSHLSMTRLQDPDPQVLETLDTFTAERLRTAGEMAEAAGVLHHRVRLSERQGVRPVLEQLARWRCSLVLVASPAGDAVARLLQGCLAPPLITRSPVPVIVCKPPFA